VGVDSKRSRGDLHISFVRFYLMGKVSLWKSDQIFLKMTIFPQRKFSSPKILQLSLIIYLITFF